MDIVAGGRCEKDDCAGKVFRLSPATGGNAIEDLACPHGVVLQGLSIVRGHVAGCNGVDVDAFGSPLIGEGLGELSYAALGRCIGGYPDATLKGEDRGNVDDFAGAFGQHVPAGELGEAEDAGEVDVDNRIPVFFGVVGGGRAADDAGVVDEDVDGAEVLDGFINKARADGGIAHIACQGNGFRAGFGDKFLGGPGDAGRAVHGDLGAGLGQGDRDPCAEAARGSGDECGLANQLEIIEDQGNLSFRVWADGAYRCVFIDDKGRR